ncbi:transposase family protein [Methyloversatilis sp. RAC08]|nr:transposase family protein [Methyloversatilis sp. RAC08]
MRKTRAPYPAEFRQQIIELAQAGRHPAELSREFAPTSQTIINWVAQTAQDAGKPLPDKDGLSSAERDELSRLRRENRQIKMERYILAKATA